MSELEACPSCGQPLDEHLFCQDCYDAWQAEDAAREKHLADRIERGKVVAGVGIAMIRAAFLDDYDNAAAAEDGVLKTLYSLLHWPEKGFKSTKRVVPPRIRKLVMERDAYRCQQCGSWKDLVVDHIKPESRGGIDLPENLQVLCAPCNSRKGAKV